MRSPIRAFRRFDRLNESSSSEGEEEEEEEVEMQPTAKQTALKGIAAGMMSGLGDALDAAPAPEPAKPPPAAKSTTQKSRKAGASGLKERLMDAGSPPSDSISDDDFSEFMAGGVTSA